jgi:transposase, IS5 family
MPYMFTGLKSQRDFSDLFMMDIIPPDHELVKMKNIINWEKINLIYRSCYKSKKGNKTIKTEIAIGLILLRRYYMMSYRDVIKELHVNNAFMYFCNISHYDIMEYNMKGKKIIDHSTLVKILGRLGKKKIKKIEKSFRKELIEKKIIDGKHLSSDTTSMESNIIYPTEVNLLNRVIENAQKIVQKVIFKKDMIKSEVIKKAKSISKVFYSSTIKSKELLKNCTSKLIEIAEEQMKEAEKSLSEINDFMLKAGLLAIHEKLERVGRKIIEQIKLKHEGKKVSDKIVSYFEEHARALPKGKIHKPCEFGMKLRIDISGNNYITNYELYEGNPSEAGMLVDVIKSHAETFKEDFESSSMDRAYYDEERIAELEKEYDIDLVIPHKKDRNKKMSKKEKKLYDKRSAIEAKISEGKRMTGLGKCMDKGNEKHEIWASLSVYSLNMRKLLRDMKDNKALALRFANN